LKPLFRNSLVVAGKLAPIRGSREEMRKQKPQWKQAEGRAAAEEKLKPAQSKLKENPHDA